MKKKKSMIDWLGEKFLGTNIGHYFPWLIPLYFKIRRSVSSNREQITEVQLFDGETKLFVAAQNSLLGLELQLKGIFEEKDTYKMLEEVKSGDLFVDVGANIGYYTTLIGKKIGDTGLVIAVEPDSFNLNILKKNIRNNMLSNVRIFEGAAGEQEGKAKISNERDHAQTEVHFDTNEGDVQVQTLTEIVSELGNNVPVSLLKVDVEGAEMSVLYGAKQLFEAGKIAKIMIEINPNKLVAAGQRAEGIIEYLSRYFHLSIDEGKTIVTPENIVHVTDGKDYVNVWGTAVR